MVDAKTTLAIINILSKATGCMHCDTDLIAELESLITSCEGKAYDKGVIDGAKGGRHE